MTEAIPYAAATLRMLDSGPVSLAFCRDLLLCPAGLEGGGGHRSRRPVERG
jgi:hypothetical protein